MRRRIVRDLAEKLRWTAALLDGVAQKLDKGEEPVWLIRQLVVELCDRCKALVEWYGDNIWEQRG
ncbi:MAG: hypothetical protein DRN81_06755 [Thermoproteota archaeon]|nr:MAG: hypothetical protein DRN81_06755 [Candidatus Korarchaeota archaeon]